MKEPSANLNLPSVEDIHRWASWRESLDAFEGESDEEDTQLLLYGIAGPITVDYYYDRAWEQDQPAGRAIPAQACPEDWTDYRQLLEHTCHLKHTQFYLPEQVPVPSLQWTPQDGNGDVHDAVRITVHPALVIQGEEGLRDGLQSSAERLRLRAAQLLIKAYEREGLCDAPMELPDGSRVPTSMEDVRGSTGDGAASAIS